MRLTLRVALAPAGEAQPEEIGDPLLQIPVDRGGIPLIAQRGAIALGMTMIAHGVLSWLRVERSRR